MCLFRNTYRYVLGECPDMDVHGTDIIAPSNVLVERVKIADVADPMESMKDIEQVFDLEQFTMNVKTYTKTLGNVIVICPDMNRIDDPEFKKLFASMGFEVTKSLVYTEKVKKTMVFLKKVT